MSKVQPRDVSNVVRFIRKALNCGRETKNALRFESEWSKRSQPPPNLPSGPHHKLSHNYYLSRDARRQIKPPLVIKDTEVAAPTKQISS